jgi:NADPH-dependent 2,4-dienoyl-CoA reductase/sulfur reductase-like enzyme
VSSLKSVTIVGASTAGLAGAVALRDEGFDGRIDLVGQESHAPYDRPPLSKQALTSGWGLDRLTIRTTEEIASHLQVEVHLGTPAVGLDVAERRVRLRTGESITSDAVLVTTGTTPNQLNGGASLRGIHTLRNYEDAVAIGRAFTHAPRVLVVGGGFIGSEIASSARANGLEVTIVEAQPQVLARSVGRQVADLTRRLHEENGTSVVTGRRVMEVLGHGRVESVVLSDGSRLDADLVVVGVGVSPSTNWLVGSGLTLRDGIVCDAQCRSSAPGIYAAGDVARWYNARYATEMRVEHWDNSRRMAAAAARNMLDARHPSPYVSVPYVWSDLYGTRIQAVGRVTAHEILMVATGSPQPHAIALYRWADQLAGVLGVNEPRAILGLRRLLANPVSWNDALDAVASFGDWQAESR